MKIRTYNELMRLRTFEDRLEYLKLEGCVGEETFGFDRWLNQQFYNSKEWRLIRKEVIARDFGCDLAFRDYEVEGKIIIHHMNPIIVADLIHSRDGCFDTRYLITTSMETHNYIHYGRAVRRTPWTERREGDTKLW